MLKAYTKKGKPVALYHLNSQESSWCLGTKEENLPWRFQRDRYLLKIKEMFKDAMTPEVERHIHKIKCQPYLSFNL